MPGLTVGACLITGRRQLSDARSPISWSASSGC